MVTTESNPLAFRFLVQACTGVFKLVKTLSRIVFSKLHFRGEQVIIVSEPWRRRVRATAAHCHVTALFTSGVSWLFTHRLDGCCCWQVVLFLARCCACTLVWITAKKRERKMSLFFTLKWVNELEVRKATFALHSFLLGTKHHLYCLNSNFCDLSMGSVFFLNLLLQSSATCYCYCSAFLFWSK